MTTTIRYHFGDIAITVECKNVKEAMKHLSEYADVFGETVCGLCKSEHVVPRCRVAKGYDFYEMQCLSCGARLSFGQTKEGDSLFPKRFDEQGRPMDGNGWHHWKPQQSSQQSTHTRGSADDGFF